MNIPYVFGDAHILYMSAPVSGMERYGNDGDDIWQVGDSVVDHVYIINGSGSNIGVQTCSTLDVLSVNLHMQ